MFAPSAPREVSRAVVTDAIRLWIERPKEPVTAKALGFKLSLRRVFRHLALWLSHSLRPRCNQVSSNSGV